MTDTDLATQRGLVRVDLLGDALASIADIRHTLKGTEYAEVGMDIAAEIIAEASPSS